MHCARQRRSVQPVSNARGGCAQSEWPLLQTVSLFSPSDSLPATAQLPAAAYTADTVKLDMPGQAVFGQPASLPPPFTRRKCLISAAVATSLLAQMNVLQFVLYKLQLRHANLKRCTVLRIKTATNFSRSSQRLRKWEARAETLNCLLKCSCSSSSDYVVYMYHEDAFQLTTLEAESLEALVKR